MGNLTLIVVMIFGFVVFITISVTVMKKEKERDNDRNIFNITRIIISGFNEFIKTLVSSSVGIIILAFDFAFVFATAALTQESYGTYGDDYKYFIAFLVAAVPFVFATLFANVFSSNEATHRWYAQYINTKNAGLLDADGELINKDFKRSTKPGTKNYLWTLILSDPTSLLKTTANEFKQDKLKQASPWLLGFIVAIWSTIQSVIVWQIWAVNKAAELSSIDSVNVYDVAPYLVIICTIGLDVGFIWSTRGIMARVKELNQDYVDLLKDDEQFTTIEQFAADYGYNGHTPLPLVLPAPTSNALPNPNIDPNPKLEPTTEPIIEPTAKSTAKPLTARERKAARQAARRAAKPNN